MLYDTKGFEKIYIAPGYTDLRKGLDGLAMIIGSELHLNPYQKNALFLFCGRQAGKKGTAQKVLFPKQNGCRERFLSAAGKKLLHHFTCILQVK